MGASEDELIGIPFPEHSSDLLSSLNDQRQRGLLCDVTIVTQGLEYRTHRAVLAACSHYFRKLFTSKPFSGQRNVCELDFIQPPVLAALLEFAYTATLTISSANMREVLRAARVLEIQCVADACLDILRCSGEGEQEEQLLQQEQQLLQQQQQQQQQQLGEESASAAPLLHHHQHHHHPSDSLAQEMPKIRRRKRAASKKAPRITLSNRGCLYRIVQPLRTSNNHKLHLKQQQRRPPSPASPARDQGYSMEAEGRVAAGPEEEEEEEPLDYRPQLAPPSPVDREGEGEGEGDGQELDSLSASFPFPFLSSLGAAAAAAAGPASPDNKPGGRGGGRRKSQMPQECPICHKVIHGAGKLPRHMRTHTGEKPFACEVCAVRFTRNDKLKIHMRKHTGERPYCCNCCDARFLHSYDLKNHARLHTGDRPFECSQCRKAFVRLDHLHRHLKGQNCLEVRTRRRKDDEGGDDGGVNGDSADGKGADGGESGAEYGTPVREDGSLRSDWSHLASAWDQEPPEEMAAEDSS